MTQGTAEQTMLRRTSVTIKPRVLKSTFACCAYLITVQSKLLGPDRTMTWLWEILFPGEFSVQILEGKIVFPRPKCDSHHY